MLAAITLGDFDTVAVGDTPPPGSFGRVAGLYRWDGHEPAAGCHQGATVGGMQLDDRPVLAARIEFLEGVLADTDELVDEQRAMIDQLAVTLGVVGRWCVRGKWRRLAADMSTAFLNQG